jgi:pSer/pThr/pTyr-binding forkhead associated (FHA) protein
VAKPVAAPPKKPAPHESAPPLAVSQGTQVFAGMRIPKIDAQIIEIKPDDSAGKKLRIVKETAIGRAACDITYASDALLSPRHASIQKREGKLYLKDLDSQNGTFVKQRNDSELAQGDVFVLGRELFRFGIQRMDEAPSAMQGTMVMSGAPKLQQGPATAKLEHIQLTGEVIEEFSLEKPETTIGRTTGDLVFENDPYMSGSHARIVAQPGRFILQDLKSRNGIYRRIKEEVLLEDGDEFFLGEQRFRVEIKDLEN